MDKNIVDLRQTIDKWNSIVLRKTGEQRDALICQYIKNLGLKFNKIVLDPLFSIEVIGEEVKYTDPRGVVQDIKEHNAPGIWSLLVTYKDDLIL